MLPERSLAAKSAKSVLFEEFNDIDIYGHLEKPPFMR